VTTPLPELVATLNRDRPEAIVSVPSIAGLLAGVGDRGDPGVRLHRGADHGLGLARQAGLEVGDDVVVLEVLDEHDRPVPPGVPGYRVLITSLIGRALPLIRYELSDSVTPAAASATGRPYSRIERVDGRNDDLLRLPGPGGGQAIVLPYRLRAPFLNLPDVVQYQVVHEPPRLAVRVAVAVEPVTEIEPGSIKVKVVKTVREAAA
jgi:phenylacetate-coenzyme A ligase PaaK-like adenylate-forming protein